jgi:hypothetical protein
VRRGPCEAKRRSALLARFPTRRPEHLTVRADRLRARLLVPPAQRAAGQAGTGGSPKSARPLRRHLRPSPSRGRLRDGRRLRRHAQVRGGSLALMPRRTVAEPDRALPQPRRARLHRRLPRIRAYPRAGNSQPLPRRGTRARLRHRRDLERLRRHARRRPRRAHPTRARTGAEAEARGRHPVRRRWCQHHRGARGH